MKFILALMMTVLGGCSGCGTTTTTAKKLIEMGPPCYVTLETPTGKFAMLLPTSACRLFEVRPLPSGPKIIIKRKIPNPVIEKEHDGIHMIGSGSPP